MAKMVYRVKLKVKKQTLRRDKNPDDISYEYRTFYAPINSEDVIRTAVAIAWSGLIRAPLQGPSWLDKKDEWSVVQIVPIHLRSINSRDLYSVEQVVAYYIWQLQAFEEDQIYRILKELKEFRDIGKSIMYLQEERIRDGSL